MSLTSVGRYVGLLGSRVGVRVGLYPQSSKPSTPHDVSFLQAHVVSHAPAEVLGRTPKHL